MDFTIFHQDNQDKQDTYNMSSLSKEMSNIKVRTVRQKSKRVSK